MLIIEVPDWAKIGNWVLVKDKWKIRGDDDNKWYPERILSYGYDGVFHQACCCPVYFTPFSEYGKTIKLKDD